uniref:probable inactive tRNA-specific adenosine deaminase-like protein 3 isoform X2 n=1 Tax=Fragaria vesca subsp. vesca TaxID=101020 RepID=UPI0005CA651B|nr:PREDICTED: probable inactive tRNA-specific adenosine deaminase-like protein 3 isoform X2 [Fragaria vesca subsp. vesca]
MSLLQSYTQKLPTLLRLNQIAQLENLRHVKRVHKKFVQGGTIQLSVILCLASENGNLLDNIPHDVQELMTSYQLSPFITKVCKYAALSKEEWEEQCKLWPTSFHPPTYNINGITGFGEEDSQSVVGFMKYAIQLAKSGHKMVVNAAVIIDPSVKQVIATACDQTCSWYAPASKTTLETDFSKKTEASVSQSQSDGVLSYETLHSNSLPLYTGVCCLYPWRWAEQKPDTDSCSWHPLRHAAIVAIESSAARDINLFPSSGKVQDTFAETGYTQSSSVGSPSKRQKTHSTKVHDEAHLDTNDDVSSSLSVRPYLCTGFDIYLAWEPCIMCAMALVHQRIRRIFFAFPNPNAGALGTVHRLQGERSLNHHYAVFRVMVPEEVLSRDDAATDEYNRVIDSLIKKN